MSPEEIAKIIRESEGPIPRGFLESLADGFEYEEAMFAKAKMKHFGTSVSYPFDRKKFLAECLGAER